MIMNNQKPLLKVGSNYHKTNLTIIEAKQELIKHGYIIEDTETNDEKVDSLKLKWNAM